MRKLTIFITAVCVIFLSNYDGPRTNVYSKCHSIPALVNCGWPGGNDSDNNMLKDCRTMNLLKETSPM